MNSVSRFRERIAAAALVALLALSAAACGDSKPANAAKKSAKPAATAVPSLHSRTDLRPPKISIYKRSSKVAPGFVFLATKTVFGAKKAPRAQYGPTIIDDQARVRWFEPMPKGTNSTDFHVQTYEGKPVLTYWKGRAVNAQGDGTCEILDSNYKLIASVGKNVDLHDCLISKRGTLLALAYVNERGDLRKVGGKADESVVSGRVQEYDIKTGRLLWEWSSLDHVPITDSYESIEKRYNGHWDYFHINSVAEDDDGDLIISARHTWAVYKIDRETGKVLWRFGGKRSTFPLSSKLKIAWQHDARVLGDGKYMIFDNAAGSEKYRPKSREITVKLDAKRKQATLLRSLEHQGATVSSGTQGNGTLLPNGNTFVGWGSQGRFSEFDAKGKMIFDGRVPRGQDSYRGYRAEWVGTPSSPPRAAARGKGAETTVYASYNGSTEVQSWRVLAGASAGALQEVKTADWENLETAIPVSSSGPFFAVEALDEDGKVLAKSNVTRRAAG